MYDFKQERRYKVINLDTTELIKVLNRLAEKSKYGFKPFSSVISKEQRGIVYDDENVLRDGLSYEIVLDSELDLKNHCVTKTYSQLLEKDKINVRVIKNGTDGPYVLVASELEPDFVVIIKIGRWY